MHLVPFNCHSAEKEYSQFYNQNGAGSIPIFAGAKTQQGYGLGGIFGSLLKAALPVIKKGAISLGKTALKSGINIAQDRLAGKSLKQSFKDNMQEAGQNVMRNGLRGIGNIINHTSQRKPKKQRQTNKRKQRTNSVVSVRRASKRRRRNPSRKQDIFD